MDDFVDDLVATMRQAVDALAAADRSLRRFGAARHRYQLSPPLTAGALAAAEAQLGATLPDDVRAFALEVGAGGAGPGYGIVPIDRAAAFAIAAPIALPPAPWTRALPLVDLGCGYTAICPLDGESRGQIWIDARAIGQVRAIHPSFTAFYLDWIDRLAHSRWPDPQVPPGACALAAALSGYLAHCEAAAGVAPGTLAGAALREALERLGPGAIEVAAAAPVGWYADDDRVDPCLACARVVENLAGDGLRRDAIAPGVMPLPLR